MGNVAAITPVAALRLISQHGGKDKTAAILREEADRFEQDAFRRERVALSPGNAVSGRKRARSLSRLRKATQQRGNAQCCRMAAEEIERRKVATVGQALRPWPLRVFHVLRGVWDGAEGTINRMDRPTTG
jgi:hypothetical protein